MAEMMRKPSSKKKHSTKKRRSSESQKLPAVEKELLAEKEELEDVGATRKEENPSQEDEGSTETASKADLGYVEEESKAEEEDDATAVEETPLFLEGADIDEKKATGTGAETKNEFFEESSPEEAERENVELDEFLNSSKFDCEIIDKEELVEEMQAEAERRSSVDCNLYAMSMDSMEKLSAGVGEKLCLSDAEGADEQEKSDLESPVHEETIDPETTLHQEAPLYPIEALREEEEQEIASPDSKFSEEIDVEEVTTEEGLEDGSITEEPANELLQVQEGNELHEEKECDQVKESPAEEPAVKTRVEPMPLLELLALHQNTSLERNDFYVSSFVASQARVDREPLYDLLSAYSNARTRLVTAIAKVRSSRDEARRIETQAWTAEMARAVVEDECADGNKVYGVRDYSLATFDAEKGRISLPATLRSLRIQLYETHTLHAHSAAVAKLRIDAHIDRIVDAFSPEITPFPPETYSTSSSSTPSCPPSNEADLNRLRSAISVLFSFVRYKHKDEVIAENVRSWLDRLVSVLLRVADRSDHLFVLNHCLRCPAGYGKWVARYIVVPPVTPVDPSRLVTPAVDHVVVMLSTMLSAPVAARDRFLAAFCTQGSKKNESGDVVVDGDPSLPGNEDKWTLLDDSDDENADRDPVELLESDLLSFLARVPFYDVLRQLLGVVGNERGGKAVVLPADADNFFKILAVASRLCEIFRAGLSTYSRQKYRNLGKLLCRFLAHLALFVGDHFEAVCSVGARADVVRRLQAEYDAFVERVFFAIRSARRFGGWQFLSQLSYKMVSLEELLELKTIALCVRFPLPAPDVDDKSYEENQVADGGIHVNGLDELVGMLSESDSFYVMAAVVKMATSRPSQCGGERRFLTSVVLDILKVGFLDSEHQDVQSKPCRDLLASLSQHHPTALSIILREVVRNVSAMEKLSIYLVRDLPWILWQPEPEDVDLLTRCLTDSPPQSLDSQCARVVISGLNFGVDLTGENLFLPRVVHQRIASAIVAAHGRHAFAAGPGFDAWAWDTVRGLKLHALHQPGTPLTSVLTGDRSHFDAVPEMSSCSGEDWLVAIRRGVEAKEPLACLVAVLSTEVGHSVPLLLSKGFEFLKEMSEPCASTAAKKCLIFALDAVLPLFYSCPSELRSCEPLLAVVSSLLAVDASYLNMAKGLVFPTFPGPTATMVLMAVRREISQARSYVPGDGPTAAILVWFEILTSTGPNWWTNPNILRLMDALCEAAIFCDSTWKVWEVLTGKLIQLQRDVPPAKVGKGAQLLSWVRAASSTSPPPLAPKWPLPEYPWFALAALRAWARWEEEDSGLFLALCRELVGDNGLSLEAAFKRACQMSGSSPRAGANVSLPSLSIYKWAQQIIACTSQLPANVCPTLPFVVQEFYSKFFYRVPSAGEYRASEFASVGFKFFEDSSNFATLKNIKKKLSDAKALAEKRATGVDSSFDDDDLEAIVFKDIKYWKNVASILDAASVWLEERSLHEIHVYLESLPPRYLADLLNSIYQGDRTPWYSCLDTEIFEWTIDKNNRDWDVKIGHMGSLRRVTPRNVSSRTSSDGTSSHREPQDPSSRILSRLKEIGVEFTRYANVLRLDTTFVAREREVGEIKSFSPGLLSSPASVLTVVEPRIRALAEIAQFSSKRTAEHVGLDANFVEDLLPKLYEAVEKVATVVATCRDEVPPGVVTGGSGVGSSLRGLASAVKQRHGYGHAPPPCRGPVHMKIKYAESRVNEAIGYQISQNRKDWDIMIRQTLEPPAGDVLQAAFILTELVTSLCDSKDNPWAEGQFAQSGLAVFYCLVDGITPELEVFPPTRQLFSSLVEKLGQTFVNSRVKECSKLLDKILSKPTLLGLLAPHWAMVSAAPPEIFLPVYRRVLLEAFSFDDFPDLPFVLLSKCDLKIWLPRTKPLLMTIDDLVEAQMSALTDEPREASSLAPTGAADIGRGPAYALVRRHFRHCVAWQFPASFSRTLDRLILGSRGSNDMPIALWHEFLAAVVAANQIRSPPGGVDVGIDSWVPVWRNFAQQQVGMNLNLLLDTLRRLSKRMEEDRTGGMSTYGLYSMYRNYIKPLACLFGLLSNAFVIASLQADVGSLSVQLLRSTWKEILALYRYWIMPATLPYSADTEFGAEKATPALGVPSLPWVPTDAPLADHMLAAFGCSVALLHETVPASHSALSILWEWYVKTYANGFTKPHVLAAVHARLTTLPWRTFWPGQRDVELMTKLLDSYLPDCHGFLGSVFVRVCWSEVLSAALDQPSVRMANGLVNPQLAARQQQRGNSSSLVCDYFCLLIKLAREPSVRQSEFLWPLLTQADRFPLSQAVDQASYEKLVQWFLLSCDPKIVLDVAEKDIIDFQSHKLLEAASGIHSKKSSTASSVGKSRFFVRLYVRLLISCQSKFKALFATRSVAVRDSVRRMAGLVERKCGELEPGPAATLLDELFLLVIKHDVTVGTSTAPSKGESDGSGSKVSAVEQGLLDWISTMSWRSNSGHSMLRAVVAGLGRLVKVGGGASGGHWRPEVAANVGRLIEAAIGACFRLDVLSSRQESDGMTDHWDEVSRCLWSGVGAPGPDFWHVCGKEGLLLVLYSVGRARSSTTPSIDLAKDCVNWVEDAKHCSSMEPKFFLLWDQILESMSHALEKSTASQVNDNGGVVADDRKRFLVLETELLVKLTSLTMALSEEREGGGFLGAIGFGRRSQFSSNFRFSCACLAAALVVVRAKNNGLEHHEAHHHGHRKLQLVDSWRPILFDKTHAAHAEMATWVLEFLQFQASMPNTAGEASPVAVDSNSEAKNLGGTGTAGFLLDTGLRREFMRRTVGAIFPAPYLTEVLVPRSGETRSFTDSD